MASGVVLRRRKVISDHLYNISVTARKLCHAKSTDFLQSSMFSTSSRKTNIMVNSAFGLSRTGCYVNIASGIGKSEFGFMTGPRTTSRFISYDPVIDEDDERLVTCIVV